MSANPNNPDDDDVVASSSDTRGLLPKDDDHRAEDGGSNSRNRTGMNRVRSSIEVGSDDEDHRGRDDRGGDGGGEGGGGAHPFQAAPGYRVRRSTADADGSSSRNNGDLVFRMEDWKFERLSTVPWAALLGVANMLVIFTVFFTPIMCLPTNVPPSEAKNVCPIEPFSILIYVHVTYWVLHLIGDQILKHAHKSKRLQGYTEFYLETKNVRRAPFYIVSVGNALILTTSTVLHDYCDKYVCTSNKFTNIDFLRGIITVECIFVMFMWLYYSRQVQAFNRAANRPDFMRVDLMREWLVDLGDVGDDEEEKHLKTRVIAMLPEERDFIIEKHAELIRYMIAHVAKQNKKIIELAMHPSIDADRY